jgi:poly [ADP-ribose] polymerase
MRLKNPMDIQYSMLKADMVPLEAVDTVAQSITRCIAETHGPTHLDYALEVQQVFSVDRGYEKLKFMPFTHLKRNLLWHGSRLSNMVGILSQGLRIAPPEAPKTGYMFGKGVYFADCPSKSANYCYPNRADPYGLLILSEVAVGNAYHVKKADYMDAPPQFCHSTEALGKQIPDAANHVALDEGGALMATGSLSPTGPSDSTLMYNETVVYDVDQVCMRYVVLVKFKYADRGMPL